MDIKAGAVITISHYSGVNPFKSILLEIKGEQAVVKLTKEFAVMNFLEGDPVVFGYEQDDKVYIYGCNIKSLDLKQSTITLEIDNVDFRENKRQSERFPVSLYADIKTQHSNKKHLATIKDISKFGLLIYSKADIPEGTTLEIDIYTDKNMIFLKANVVRKVKQENYFEYGLNIVYQDNATMSFMENFIERLKLEQEKMVRRLGNK